MAPNRFVVAVLAAALMLSSGEPRPLGQARPPAASGSIPADRPAPRTDANSMLAHEQLLDKARRGGIDVYFLGDSIVRRWGATDYPELLANWKANFFGWNAANFGWGADRIENILWRVEHGELDGVNPKVIVLLAARTTSDRSRGMRPKSGTSFAVSTRWSTPAAARRLLRR